MAKAKTATGEMNNVANVEGATLTVIDDPPTTTKVKKRRKKRAKNTKAVPVATPTPVVVPAPPKKRIIRIKVQAEFGSFEELAETMTDGIRRAEEMIRGGAWQKAGNQMILHMPSSIRRVIVVE